MCGSVYSCDLLHCLLPSACLCMGTRNDCSNSLSCSVRATNSIFLLPAYFTTHDESIIIPGPRCCVFLAWTSFACNRLAQAALGLRQRSNNAPLPSSFADRANPLVQARGRTSSSAPAQAVDRPRPQAAAKCSVDGKCGDDSFVVVL
jgi:hypothetical protein